MSKAPERYRKDRARPFSRKHARYWLTAAGGMVFIMLVNLGLGIWFMNDTPKPPPPAQYRPLPPLVVPLDAGVDGGAAAPAASDPAAAPLSPR